MQTSLLLLALVSITGTVLGFAPSGGFNRLRNSHPLRFKSIEQGDGFFNSVMGEIDGSKGGECTIKVTTDVGPFMLTMNRFGLLG